MRDSVSSEHSAVHQEEKGQPGAKLVKETVGMSNSYRSSHSGARALQLGVPYGLLSCVQVDKPIPACSRRPGPEPGREQSEAADSVGSQGATQTCPPQPKYCLTLHKAHATGTQPMGCQAGPTGFKICIFLCWFPNLQDPSVQVWRLLEFKKLELG